MEPEVETSERELERIGYAVVQLRWLEGLRERMGLSRNALAELMGTSPVTLKRWEEGEVRVWAKSAVAIGKFHLEALKQLERMQELGYAGTDLVLLDRVSGMLGGSIQEGVHLEEVDLGVLGVYAKRSQVDSIRAKMGMRGYGGPAV